MLKQNKKTLIMFLLLTTFSLLLVACGDSDSDNESSDGNAQGVTDDEILIGYLGPQTGQTAVYDLYRKGTQSYLNYVNENGGVNGRELELIAYDDEYEPAQAVQLSKRLVEDDEVFAVLGEVCTPCNAAVKDYYVEKNMPMIMLGSGDSQFTEPPIENYMGSNIINYKIEAKVFLDYAVNELDAKKIALSYQNDDFGQEGYEGVLEEIDNYEDVEIVEEVNYQSGDVDFSSQAEKLKNADADAILSFSVTEPTANLKKALYKVGVETPFLASSVGANDTNLFDLAGADAWEGTLTSAVFPMPDQSNDEGMKEFEKQFKKDYPDDPLAGYAQVGWAGAQVFVEALERSDDDLSWDNFLETFYTFDDWEGSMYEGVSFTEDNHYGLTSLILVEAKDGEIVPITETISFDPETKEITTIED